MTRDEIAAVYRTYIAQLGLNQTGAGRYLGVHARTGQTWANAEARIPPVAMAFLELMIRSGLTPADYSPDQWVPDEGDQVCRAGRLGSRTGVGKAVRARGVTRKSRTGEPPRLRS